MALINISGKSYELVIENKSGWNAEAFRNRYSEVLERYDYIVGDWGYNQLRLKGFFKEGNSKATKDSAFSFVMDYINEYCNFGCAYFVIEKVSDHGEKAQIDDDIDPLIADLDEEYVAIDKADIQEEENVLGEDVNQQEGDNVVEIKQAKSQPNKNNQDKQSQSQQKSQDKAFKRRPIKQRSNNKSNTNNVLQEETVKQPVKKNKRRSNRPFRHFDRKKSKEQVSSNQE